MIELAQLFQDMEVAVATQEEQIEGIDENTNKTVDHLEQGNQHLGGAVVKARSARKKKWICFWIVGKFCVVIALFIALFLSRVNG